MSKAFKDSTVRAMTRVAMTPQKTFIAHLPVEYGWVKWGKDIYYMWRLASPKNEPWNYKLTPFTDLPYFETKNTTKFCTVFGCTNSGYPYCPQHDAP